jgi:hypothetical protein
VQPEPSVKMPSILVSPEIYQTLIDKLGLSPRTLNCLKRAHIVKVGEVLEMSDEDLLKIRNFGEKSLEELHLKLGELGVHQQPVLGSPSAGVVPAIQDEEDEPGAEPDEEPADLPDPPVAGLESLGAALRAASRRGAAAKKEES